MTDNTPLSGRPPGEEDLRYFSQNVSQMDFAEEQRQHGGQLAARSFDGRTTWAYTDSDEELDRKLLALGVDPSQVIVSFVFPSDHPFLAWAQSL